MYPRWIYDIPNLCLTISTTLKKKILHHFCVCLLTILLGYIRFWIRLWSKICDSYFPCYPLTWDSITVQIYTSHLHFFLMFFSLSWKSWLIAQSTKFSLMSYSLRFWLVTFLLLVSVHDRNFPTIMILVYKSNPAEFGYLL